MTDRRMRLPWDHNGSTVLASVALAATISTTGLAFVAPGAERHDAVFHPELDEICTNLTGRAVFDGRSTSFNDGDTRVRDLPAAWQHGEPIPGQILIDGDELTFVADDGVVLRFDDKTLTELHCALG
ncbi:MAG: hypothetical protein AAGE98_03730 [Actinomycetota bacterium]